MNMPDFNNLDPNNMQEKADEVVANAEKVINEAEPQPQPQPEQQPQPEAPQYQVPPQPQQPQYQQPQQPYGQQPQQPYGQQPQYQQPQQPYGQYPYQPPMGGYEQKSKLVAGLLGIFLGSIGIHNFYLGLTSRAVIQIVVSVVTCGVGGVWGFIEGILILCGNYHNNVDANGVPLKE